MKIKILLMPLMLIGSIYMAIWVAKPAYYDTGGIVELKAKLENSSARLDDVSKRVDNSKRLRDELNQPTVEQKIVFHYLPDQKLNEDIVASLNALATSNVVSIKSLSFKDVKDKVVVEEFEASSMGDSAELNQSMDSPQYVAPKKTPFKTFNADVVIEGDYEKIRKFIADLAAFKRFNDVESLEIKKSDKEGTAALTASMTLRLSYMEKMKSVTVIDKNMFMKSNFDMKVADEIRNKSSIDITKLGVDTAGRTNPFDL